MGAGDLQDWASVETDWKRQLEGLDWVIADNRPNPTELARQIMAAIIGRSMLKLN